MKVSSTPVGPKVCVIGRIGLSPSTHMLHLFFSYPYLSFSLGRKWTEDIVHKIKCVLTGNRKDHTLLLDVPDSKISEKFVSVVYITLPVILCFRSLILDLWSKVRLQSVYTV